MKTAVNCYKQMPLFVPSILIQPTLLLIFMRSLHKMHKVKAWWGCSVCWSAYFMSGTSRRIYIKFGIGDNNNIHRKVFNFGAFREVIMSVTLYQDQTEFLSNL